MWHYYLPPSFINSRELRSDTGDLNPKAIHDFKHSSVFKFMVVIAIMVGGGVGDFGCVVWARCDYLHFCCDGVPHFNENYLDIITFLALFT
jgi:hypothetical protein